MKHTKILKRSNGGKVIIDIVFVTRGYYDEHIIYTEFISIVPPGKRKGVYVYDNISAFVSPEEILQAKLELWEKMKPV